MRFEITQYLVNLDKEFGFHSKCDEKALEGFKQKGHTL